MANMISTKREADGTWSYLLLDEWIPTAHRETFRAAAEGAKQTAAHQRFLDNSRKSTYLDWRHG